MGMVDRNLIFAQLTAENPAMQRALGIGKNGKKVKQSPLMEKLNKPLKHD